MKIAIDNSAAMTTEPPVAKIGAARSGLLDVIGLSVAFRTSRGDIPVIRDVGFTIAAGERVGIVGESGCGKTVAGLSLLRLLPARSTRLSGRIIFGGRDLLTFSARQMRAVRGREIGMIFQEPMSALDPVFTVGDQISEAYRTHFPTTRKEGRERAIAALASVGIPAPERRCDDYPHQLSGGMRQRVMIAMALICEPKLLIADEPTTALDVTVQAQIIDLLCRLSDRTGTAMMFITHDLGAVAETCTRMITMYAGEIVEDAPVDEVLVRPRHPYTSGLLLSLPGLAARHSVLRSIPGLVPPPQAMPKGCRFQPRCSHALDGCAEPQSLTRLSPSHRARCGRAREIALPGAVNP
ncbi:MAG: ABC transporter ATP-binding protein [Rhodospirillales bacterium]|nr:ABC transporter ATP-binding protein [Rhodospirillales bacterium]